LGINNCRINDKVKNFENRKQNTMEIYTSLQLLNDLKKEVTKIVSLELLSRGILSNERLSIILGQAKSHIAHLFRRIKNDSNYLITSEFLEGYIDNLILKYGKRSFGIIEKIKYYKNLNDPLDNYLDRLKYSHPQLIRDFFKVIDTKDKAYWLGFIYADGSIYRSCEGDDYSRFGITIARKDKILLERFAKAIGFNSKYISLYERKRIKKGVENTYEMVKLEFKSKEFTYYLKQLGIMPKKTFKIQLPDLGSRELNLAFLLGFFDGDGRQGFTSLRSANKKFLEQIKDRYEIPFDIYYDKHNPGAFTLSLGGTLFNEMMLNYENSLPRKRKIFTINKFKTIELTEDLLQNLIWEMPLYVIAREYGLSQSTLSRLVKKYGLKLPPSTYWRDNFFLGKENQKNFKDFFKFFKENSKEELSFYYRSFPFNASSKIRAWVYKAKKIIEDI